MTFFPATWGQLSPGDLVKDAHGRSWVVGNGITQGETVEWEISNPELGSVWTSQGINGPVLAARPPCPLGDMDAEELLGRMRLFLGPQVDMLSKEAASEDPDAPIFLGCKQKICRCTDWMSKKKS